MLVGQRSRVPTPDLDRVVGSACDKSPYASYAAAGTDETAWRRARGPRDGVHAAAVRVEDLMRGVVVFEFEDADVAVGGGAGEQAAGFVGRPGDDVYGGSVEGVFVDLGPG